MKRIAIILTSEAGYNIALSIKKEFEDLDIYARIQKPNVISITSLSECVANVFNQYESLVFIGAMGICVRTIAPHIKDKYSDPAVINIDSTGRYAVSVLSGHVGGANELTEQLAHTIGAEAVITTQSDNMNLWALDTLGSKYDWHTETNASNFNEPLIAFVNMKATALLLDIKDAGTGFLEKTLPKHVDVFYNYKDIDFARYDVFIAVTPYLYPEVKIPAIFYHPAVLHLGVGCRKDCASKGVSDYILNFLKNKNISRYALKDISSIDLKKMKTY